MEKIKHTKGHRITDTTYRANVKAFYQPEIIGSIEVGGETFYIDNEGRHYRPALFDAMFKAPGGTVEHYAYKGEAAGSLQRVKD